MTKRTALLAVLLLVSSAAAANADETWVLTSSTITYHVSHPLHEVAGVSHAAKGKGVCQAGECEFLVAVPVNSFDSGDSNRDLHMLQVTRGAQFPMVVVRVSLPEKDRTQSDLRVSVEVGFAGQKTTYRDVKLHASVHNGVARLTGTLPVTLKDFKINPPSLLTIPIRNDVPVDVDLTWTRTEAAP
jgi:YceI-like domain